MGWGTGRTSWAVSTVGRAGLDGRNRRSEWLEGQGPGEDRVGRQHLNCAASLRPSKEFALYCRPPQGKLSRFLLHGITRVVRYKDPGGYDGERAGVGSWIMDT